MRLCLCRHKATRLRRDRRGQATVIGTLFFFMIALSLITFIYEIAQNQIVMQHQDAERVTETVGSELLVLPDGDLFITVENRGSIPVKLIGLWVIDKTENNHTRYDIPDLKSDIFPWEEIEIRTDVDTMNPEWFHLDDEHEYSIRLVTDRGNIIEARPFQAISGETITISAYPPWVSLAESEFSLDPSETPVISISKNNDGDPYTQGDTPWLSIKNSGSVPFIITRRSRLIFKDSTTGDVYASELANWETFTWDGSWNRDDHGAIDVKKDTKVIYPYPREPYLLVLQFLIPMDAPGDGTRAPSGTYQVYLHLSGYDDTGNTFFQNIYYGELTF